MGIPLRKSSLISLLAQARRQSLICCTISPGGVNSEEGFLVEQSAPDAIPSGQDAARIGQAKKC
jgi:hypothetical protein